MQDAPPGFRQTKSAPSSPAKPLFGVPRTRSESFHVIHKVPIGGGPYVRAKNAQLVDKDPARAVPLFWAAINAGDRVDSALKDMAIVMKQQNRAEEAIEAIKSLRCRCSDMAQESLDNILLDLYKVRSYVLKALDVTLNWEDVIQPKQLMLVMKFQRCGRLDDQIALLKHKLYLIQQGLAFNGKRTKTARSQGKKFQVSVEQEATRLLGNLGWALMQRNNYVEAEEVYKRALSMAPDNNKMCNLGICLMKQGRISEAKETLRLVRPAVADGPRGIDSHLKAYERAQQMLEDLETQVLFRGGDRVEQSKLFDAFLGSSSIWQPQPCRDQISMLPNAIMTPDDDFADENVESNIITAPGIGHVNQKDPKSLLYSALNKDAQLFSAMKLVPPQISNEMLKRSGSLSRETFCAEPGKPPEHKSRPLLPKDEVGRGAKDNPLLDLLPNNEDFEEAILTAALGGPIMQHQRALTSLNPTAKLDRRLKVFQEIAIPASPKDRIK